MIRSVVAVSPMNAEKCDAAYLLKFGYGEEKAEVFVEFAAPSSVASGCYAEEVVRRFLRDDEPPQRLLVETGGHVFRLGLPSPRRVDLCDLIADAVAF